MSFNVCRHHGIEFERLNTTEYPWWFKESTAAKDKAMVEAIKNKLGLAGLKPYRIIIHRGQTLVMHGYLVHAGDRGYLGHDGLIVAAPRIHR